MSQRFRRRKRPHHTIQAPAWQDAPILLAQVPDETDVTGNMDLFMRYLETGAFAMEWERAAARAQDMLADKERLWC